MRKNITTYNHKKFAQALQPQVTAKQINFKDPKYINRILSSKTAVQDLLFLAIRATLPEDAIKEAKNSGNYDKIIFGSMAETNKYIEFLQSLENAQGIDKTKLKSVKEQAINLIGKKLTENLQTPPPQTPGAQAVNQQVPPAPNVLSPAQAAEMERPKITPEQADKYLSNVLKTLEDMSNDTTKPKEFTRRYSSEFNYIVDSLNIIKFDPKLSANAEAYNKRLTNLGPIFNKLMHPTGYSVAGDTVFVTDWYTLGDQIIKDLQSKNWSSAKDKLTTFQNEFLNKNPGNTDISGVANKVNQVLDQANAGIGRTLPTLPRLR